jgi:signal transduction histidine kinase
MAEPQKIAIVRDPDRGLGRLLEARPERPQVRTFEDPFASFEEILDFAPELLIHDGAVDDPEEVGALRILARALPQTRFVLVGPRDREVDLSALGRRLGARVLLRPFDRRAVAAVLAAAADPDHPDADVFLDLARGISDEVNNPLLFAAGHLQLLEALLDPDRDVEALDQVRAAQRGLDRIRATMDRIRTIGRARRLRAPLEPVELGALLEAAAEEVAAAGGPRIAVFGPGPADGGLVHGDQRLLGEAMRAFAGVAAELTQAAEEVCLLASADPQGVRIRIEARGLRLGDWQLPRAFEPYALNRVLRGTSHGLSLFLVQTVVHAHGGSALARRRPDGTLLLDLLLPAPPRTDPGAGGPTAG